MTRKWDSSGSDPLTLLLQIVVIVIVMPHLLLDAGTVELGDEKVACAGQQIAIQATPRKTGHPFYPF